MTDTGLSPNPEILPWWTGLCFLQTHPPFFLLTLLWPGPADSGSPDLESRSLLTQMIRDDPTGVYLATW